MMKSIIIIKEILWDVDIEKIDLKRDKRLIIERVLKYGVPEQIIWLLKNYTEESIIEIIKRSRNIDKRTINYWALHFHIPKEEILCLKMPLMQDCFY